MKQIIFQISFMVLLTFFFSQDALSQYEKRDGQFSHAAVITIGIPVGTFQQSHIAGAGLSYQWSPSRFGQAVKVAKKLGYTAGAGADFYIGKEVETAGYKFNYERYLYFYIKTGLMYNLFSDTQLILSAGPGLGLYEGEAKVGLLSEFSGNYFFDNRWSIGPGLQFRKQAKTDALWSATIRASYVF